jgi:hypothetical protein
MAVGTGAEATWARTVPAGKEAADGIQGGMEWCEDNGWEVMGVTVEDYSDLSRSIFNSCGITVAWYVHHRGKHLQLCVHHRGKHLQLCVHLSTTDEAEVIYVGSLVANENNLFTGGDVTNSGQW